MDKILVTIITPTYNHEKFIEKCIDSVLSQSYPYWEQIIVDDGSNDNTKDLISKYTDKRIKYIGQNNKGIFKLNETYNKALEHSNGELIAVLEGDDFWPHDKLEKQVPCFKDPDVVLSWGKAIFTDVDGESLGYRPKSIDWLRKIPNKKMIKYLFFGDFIPACTVMCRKNALLNINGFQQPPHTPYVDYSTWLELLLEGKFYYIDDVLGFWRHHARQISATMSLEMIKSSEYSIDFFKKISKDVKFHVGLTDLITFNFIQVKYNIIHALNGLSKKEKKNKDNKEKNPLKTTLHVNLSIIYAIFKINVIWMLELSKNIF